jgi:conjugative relaxase-like TrwC/TraI family protein
VFGLKNDFDIHAANKEYFKRDESLKRGKELETQPIWSGSLSHAVKLSGEVDEEMFLKVQDGILPNGRRMRGKNQTGDEIFAHDMVLGAPKTVTLHALEDRRVFEAYMRCCQETIAVAEQHYALHLEGKDRHRALGQGFIAAVIPHWTNRNLGPHLHCHCVIMNGTKTQAGQWRALDMHPISREQWLGNYFRSALNREMNALGYRTHEVPNKNGTYNFEIDGISREHIKVFSSRLAEIEKGIEENGWKPREAVYKTRKRKAGTPSWQDIKATTREIRESLGITLQTPGEPISTGQDATEAVKSAIAHLSERSCRFEQIDIYQRVFAHVEGFGLEEVDRAIAANKSLIDYGLVKGNPELKGQYTTLAALEREIRTINTWFEGQNTVVPILSKAEVLQRIDPDSVNQGQLEAVIGLLSSQDAHQILHGLSGVGKTRTLKPFKALAESENIKLRWFAPSLDAAKKLGESIGGEAETLQRLVYTDYKIYAGEVLVVDEAGLASAEMVDILVQKATAAGARILLVGDTGQNKPIDAGSPAASLMEAGATTHNVREILRQKNKVQRRAVTLASQGNATEALNLLDKHEYVNEIEDRGIRAQAIADEYLALSPEERAKTLIVAGTHSEKDAIVEQIRAGLKTEGSLGESIPMTQLRDRGWTKEHGMDIRHYQVGDYIATSKTWSDCPLLKDRFHQIVGIEGNLLKVQSEEGEIYDFDPSKYIEKRVFSTRTFDIAIGDELRWQHTNYKWGRKNGETFTVIGIQDKTATIKDAKGHTRYIRLDAPLPADYTITTTNYRAQGSDRQRVFVAATNDPTSNKEAFYVSISRQIHELKIWTSSLASLRYRVARSNLHPNSLKGLYEQQTRRDLLNGAINQSTAKRYSRNLSGKPIQPGGNDSHTLDGDRRAAEQTTRGGQQDLGGIGFSSHYHRGDSRWRRGESEAVDGTERHAQDGIETVAEKLIEVAYREKMGKVLAEPLARLAHALARFEETSQINHRLVRAHSEAVALAIDEWKHDPAGNVEDYIGYAIDAVNEFSPDEFYVIDPEVIELNMERIEGREVIDRLLSHKLATMGSGQFVTAPQRRLMDRYEGVAEGGWWAKGGLNPQKMDEPQEWGTFKANSPRWIDDEPIKYESPLGIPRGIFLPYVPDRLAQEIYKKYGIEADTKDFWKVVRDHNLPIVITEGAKKTWASLSRGIITIGVSGVNGLYVTKDANGEKLPRRELNPDIAVFATPEREITIAFDQDSKPRTIENVRRDMVRGIELLQENGCVVKVAQWGTDTKGLDDLMLKRGAQAYFQALSTASSPEAHMEAHYLLQYERLSAKVQRNYPGAPQEFIDTEVWIKARHDGPRFVGAAAKIRGLNPVQYCKELQKHGPQLRVEFLKEFVKMPKKIVRLRH